TLFAIIWVAPILAILPRGRQIGYDWHALLLLFFASARWLISDNLIPLARAWDRTYLDASAPLMNLAAVNVVLICVALFVVSRRRWITAVQWDAHWLRGGAAAWISALIFAMLNFELLRFVDLLANQELLRDPTMVKQMTLSILWAAVGFGSVVVGFWRDIRPLRYAALGLLGITLAKILLVDMAGVNAVWRV